LAQAEVGWAVIIADDGHDVIDVRTRDEFCANPVMDESVGDSCWIAGAESGCASGEPARAASSMHRNVPVEIFALGTFTLSLW